ncbi:hypothetical protein ABGB19_10070 [Mycobacterium sp. B14F4]|uniref:hypothetical protein n=1 Tax=Mycobacterium sp. B14F4 TaxID=3153565 RepID=UPI00325E0552
MSLMRMRQTAAGIVASVAVLAPVAPAAAQPLNPIPGSGFFLVGPDVAPGLYRTDGTASNWQIWINDVPTQDSMCLWFTYSTPDANKDHVVATNMSIGPMYATLNETVKAFETRNCEPWTRVP